MVRSISRWQVVWLLALPLALVSCRKPIAAELDRPVDVPVGRAVRFSKSDLELFFRRVASDSRCPRNVTCITAGEAFVSFDARVMKGYPEAIQVRIEGEEALADSMKATLFDGYRIWALRLEPYPVSGTARDTTAYFVTIQVHKR